MAQGTANEPIQHWAQGLAKLAQGALGGYQIYQADQEDIERDKRQTALLLGAPGLQPQTVPAANSYQPSGANAARPEMPATNNSVPNRKIYSQDELNPVDVASVSGPRPGGPVMASSKVWGDDEAEKAGLYEPSAVSSVNRTTMAQGGPAAPVQASAPAAAGIPPDQAMYIRRLIADPSTRAHGVAMYQAAQAQAAGASKPTDEIREYEYSQKNPGFKNFKEDLKRAGAIQNQVTIDQKGESEFAKESGKLQAKRFGELAEAGPKARQLISDIEVLRSLGSQIETGRGAEAKARFGPYAEALGVKVDGLSEIQAYEAIVNRLAPSMRVAGSGAQSDYELRGFLKSLPSIGNSAGGNEIISQTLQGVAQNQERASDIASRVMAGQISRTAAEKELAALPDPMANYRSFVKKTMPAAARAQQDIRQKYGLE